MIPNFIPVRRWALLMMCALLVSCMTYEDRIPPVPLPSSNGDHVDVEGARVAAQAYADPEQAEQAFGFDIRGAGLLPVRLVIDNQSASVVKVNPQQTFLVDRDGQAWPLLTGEQAHNRLASAVQFGVMARNAGQAAAWGGGAGALTSFAIGLILDGGLGGGFSNNLLEHATVGAGVGAIVGGGQDSQGLEDRIRRDLIKKSLRNQRLQPGELAYGYLFFPGKEEARSAKTLRIGLELDGYPQVANLPLKPPAPR
ncbi:hypothetical protein [Methylocaldum sp.]|uniref:hypothetical protein n=1 Tax=Methylocaldum sp. TaxID=1969727 RepID=UPI002D53AC81|nr:hypothetical protein [Methylocaldum sp.]HYE35098.1 hypothetical protein [Methylocaldum sp.]